MECVPKFSSAERSGPHYQTEVWFDKSKHVYKIANAHESGRHERGKCSKIMPKLYETRNHPLFFLLSSFLVLCMLGHGSKNYKNVFEIHSWCSGLMAIPLIVILDIQQFQASYYCAQDSNHFSLCRRVIKHCIRRY